MSKKYIYHYHAIKQAGPRAVKHIDGLLKREKPIPASMDEYHRIKDDICADAGEEYSEGLVICSISLVNNYNIVETTEPIDDLEKRIQRLEYIIGNSYTKDKQ